MRLPAFIIPYLFVATTFSLAFSCNNPSESPSRDKPLVVTTTGMLGDAAANIAGSYVHVVSLMGPGVDPHLYKATQSDLDKLSRADLIIYNGLTLEGKMEEVLEKLSQTKKVLAVGNQLDPSLLIRTSAPQDSKFAYDPHIWFDVSLWIKVVEVISGTLQELVPAHAPQVESQTTNYVKMLEALHTWTLEQISTIPPEQRILITSHDAFHYFGRAYGVEVHALQGISTASDFGLQDITQLIQLIVERKVKAVFIETSVAPRSLEAVVEGCRKMGHSVKIGGTLYSDALGEPGTPEGTYIGMVQANVQTIVNSLK
ncbi:MAG: manganese-binding lipoprotein MntA [Chitinophagales bacterium]|nr:MAG: manganese-binding lipoprotein MntA [Chitinophagales bacterium]